MWQVIDRSRLVALGGAKAHWVVWTEEELEYIRKEDGSYDTKKIMELRRKYNQENEDQVLNPWGLDIEDEQSTTQDTQDANADNSETEESGVLDDIEEITLEQLQEEYKRLYEWDLPNRYKSDVEWLAKKIDEKKGE